MHWVMFSYLRGVVASVSVVKVVSLVRAFPGPLDRPKNMETWNTEEKTYSFLNFQCSPGGRSGEGHVTCCEHIGIGLEGISQRSKWLRYNNSVLFDIAYLTHDNKFADVFISLWSPLNDAHVMLYWRMITPEWRPCYVILTCHLLYWRYLH